MVKRQEETNLIKQIHHDQWEKEVINSNKLVLVDFFATWCGACRMVAPVIDELANEYEGKVNFVKVDVDQNKELASEYDISSIPTIAIFHNGKIVAQQTGVASKNTVKYYIDKNIRFA